MSCSVADGGVLGVEQRLQRGEPLAEFVLEPVDARGRVLAGRARVAMLRRLGQLFGDAVEQRARQRLAARSVSRQPSRR